MTARALEGLVLAACIALVARRMRALSPGGAIAAIVVGTLAVSAGWAWGALLILYFVSSSALSRVGRSTKERRTASIVAKSGERDAVQVLANGALFAAAAAAMLVRPAAVWFALGAGSLAASAADTWATELGTLYGAEPRSLLTGRPVPAGTSGAVTWIGTLAALGGAMFVAVVALLLGWIGRIVAGVAIGGFAGAFVDTLLGGAVQGRRWCDTCGRGTERFIHDCGATTRHAHGLAWVDNDIVNFLSGVAGGVLAALIGR